MEKQFQLVYNGQQIQQQDLNLLGELSGLADDRVFAELFRLAPFDGTTVARGILPTGHAGSLTTESLINANGATGTVLVRPFRALVGSRVAASVEGRKNWRDIRSVLSVAEGSTALNATAGITANASGNPRWDLVYASVTVDVDGPSVTRKVKDVTTKAVSSQSVATYKTATLALNVLAGTPDPSPVWPSVPADSGTTYQIPLAYIRVPNGFTASSTVGATDIATVAPVLTPRTSFGGVIAATTHHVERPAVTAMAWGSSGTKSSLFLPSTMSGGVTLYAAFNLEDGNLSHVSGTVFDSRDWRRRICRYTIATDSPGGLAWAPAGKDAADAALLRNASTGLGNTRSNSGQLLIINAGDHAIMADGSSITVNYDSSGRLTISYSSSPGPNCMAFLWLEFSGPIDNL